MKRTIAFALVCLLTVLAWTVLPTPVALQETAAEEAAQVLLPEPAEENTQTTAASILSWVKKTVTRQPAAQAAKQQTPKAATPEEIAEILYAPDDFELTPEPENVVEISEDLSYVKGELLVFFAEGTKDAERKRVVQSVDGTVVGKMSFLNRYTVQVQAETYEDLKALCDSLKEEKSVLFASGNISIKMQPDMVIPNDPWMELNDQGNPINNTYGWDEDSPKGSNWWLEAVRAPSAWEYNDRLSPITIGIVDSGFQTDHEDLKGKISFPNASHQRFNRPSRHGTHVAGIISANADNGVGITGLCWNASLLCTDWEPETGQSGNTEVRIFTSFVATVLGGAKVINLSIGASGSYPGRNWFEQVFFDWGMELSAFMYSYAMNKLLGMGYDFVVVQSAGNGDLNGICVDSYYNSMFCSINEKNAYTGLGGKIKKQDILDRIIVVAAAERVETPEGKVSFQQARFSNVGSGISIAAPGVSVFSTVEDNRYNYMNGTSMAAPVVTGVAAMTWAANPALTGAQVKRIVCDPANTRYIVEDNTHERHPIVFRCPMVDAKLSVEAALATRP